MASIPGGGSKKNKSRGRKAKADNGGITDIMVSKFTGRLHASLAWLYAFVNATTPAVLKIVQDSCKV